MTISPAKILTFKAPLTILVIGAEGVGKSCTINALLNKEIAPVGEGIEPQTTEFCVYHR